MINAVSSSLWVLSRCPQLFILWPPGIYSFHRSCSCLGLQDFPFLMPRVGIKDWRGPVPISGALSLCSSLLSGHLSKDTDHLSLPKFIILPPQLRVAAVWFGFTLCTAVPSKLRWWWGTPSLFPFLRGYSFIHLGPQFLLKIVVSCILSSFLVACSRKLILDCCIFLLLEVEIP